MSLARNLAMARRGAANLLAKRPICVSFEVTHACNARCKHCHLGGQVEETRIEPRRYGELRRELRPLVALVSGGEPLLRSDLEDIIREIGQPNREPLIALTTNAALLTREKYYALRRAGVDEFSVSFDYPDERHDEFRGIPGLFRKIESLVRDLAENGECAITLSCVIQRDNFRDIPRLVETARDWGMLVNLSTYTWLRTGNKDYMLRKEDLPEFRRVLDSLSQFRKRHGTVTTSDYIFGKMVEYFTNGGLPNCLAGERFCIVNADGTLSPCGLIMRDYRSLENVQQRFSKSNACVDCYTSIRAGTERPLRYLITDNLKRRR
jgi:MoaA/NifB/PqqE/SkfB family radical SAM enzyme